MIAFLDSNSPLPDPEQATPEGILAVSLDLSVSRIKEAYTKGIFPWYSANEPVVWWSPDPRMVLFPAEFKLSKSLRKVIKNNQFNVTFNANFEEVIKQCATITRAGQEDTWITSAMQQAYIELHKEGFAQSVEVWEGSKLVGGLYGINLETQGVFCGESMFSLVSNASKVGFYALTQQLLNKQYKLIDCQMHTAHLESLGAREISRSAFLQYLERG